MMAASASASASIPSPALTAAAGAGGHVEADGLPRHASPFWDGVPPIMLDAPARDPDDRIIYRRFVNGRYRFVWLIAMYDERTDTAFGYANLNMGPNAEWGLIPIRDMRQLGGRADPAWKPCPFADAIGRIAHASGGNGDAGISLPPHAMVGVDPCESEGGSRRGGVLPRLGIPKSAAPCGTGPDGKPVHLYSYEGVPQKGLVIVDNMFHASDKSAVRQARRLNSSFDYEVRACGNDGRCVFCEGRASATERRRRSAAPKDGGGLQ